MTASRPGSTLKGARLPLQPPRLSAQHRRNWRRAVARYRRLLAAGLAAGATAAALHVLVPPAAATAMVVVAAHDLPAGRALMDGDLRAVAWPADLVPRSGADGRAARLVGRTLASPVRAGEPVTDARLTGPGLLTGQASGMQAVTVRVRDAAP